MDKKSVRDRIVEIGIVPVVRASSEREALIAAEAVSEGGIPIVKITMTVPGAIEVIRELAKSNASKVLIGAGTVLDAETARRSVEVRQARGDCRYCAQVYNDCESNPAPNYSRDRECSLIRKTILLCTMEF